MRKATALLTAICILAGCVNDGTKTASGKTIIYESGNAAAGVQITITPPRAERRNAKYRFVICPAQWMLYRYINGDGMKDCWLGSLEGNPSRGTFNGVTVWNDPSPVKPRFYTRYEE